MKKFVVERNLPGAGNLSPQELQAMSQQSCEVVSQFGMEGKSYHWIQSFITEDKIYCIHIAENEEVIREHAKIAKFPINSISEVKVVIDPATSSAT